MESNAKNIFAMPQPDGNGYQISYETDTSRKVYQLTNTASGFERPPHGAGSFHDPEQHQILMKRIETYIKNIRT